MNPGEKFDRKRPEFFVVSVPKIKLQEITIQDQPAWATEKDPELIQEGERKNPETFPGLSLLTASRAADGGGRGS